LAALLANDGACVYSVDITGVQKFTRGEGLKNRRHEIVDMEGATLKDVAPLCDVVISGVPGDKYKFDTSLLREGAVCINFSSEKVDLLRYPALFSKVRSLTCLSRTSALRSRRRPPSSFLPLAR
jgi:hypothetical protein